MGYYWDVKNNPSARGVYNDANFNWYEFVQINAYTYSYVLYLHLPIDLRLYDAKLCVYMKSYYYTMMRASVIQYKPFKIVFTLKGKRCTLHLIIWQQRQRYTRVIIKDYQHSHLICASWQTNSLIFYVSLSFPSDNFVNSIYEYAYTKQSTFPHRPLC